MSEVPERVAIAIVTFNRSTYLQELLTSAAAMTTPAWKIVVVDNASTDATPRIEFVLDVKPETGAPYQVTKKATVPFTAIGSLAPGKGFQAKVAGAEEPTSMEIDWDSPLQDPSADSLDDRLRRLDDLKAQGLVTETEYDTQRRRLLDSL